MTQSNEPIIIPAPGNLTLTLGREDGPIEHVVVVATRVGLNGYGEILVARLDGSVVPISHLKRLGWSVRDFALRGV